MTKSDRSAYAKAFIETHCLPIMESKGSEYSRGEEDVNSNFKRVALSLGITPLQAAFVYAAKHWDSIANYVKSSGTGTLTEPIEGRLGDLVNYMIIMGALIEETQRASFIEPPPANSYPKSWA